MPKIIDRTVRTASLTFCLVLTALPSWSCAQGGHAGGAPSGAAHVSASMGHTTSTSPPLGARSTPSVSRTTSPNTGIANTVSPIAPTTPAPSFAAQCEGEVSANCEARAQSFFDATGGDLDTPWTAPVPTVVPPTPAAPAITEPSSDTQNFEQSGGGNGVIITAGGGPTLADCMALWEPAVHMTKALWKDICKRTMNGINEPTLALKSIDPSYDSARPAHKVRNELTSR